MATARIEGLSFSDTPLRAKIYVDSNNQLTLKAADKSASTDLVVYRISDMEIGGNVCWWNDESCWSMPESDFKSFRIFYHHFVGHFGALWIDSERLTFADISRYTLGKF